MEADRRQPRKEGWRFAVAASVASLAGALILLQISTVKRWDNELYDDCFRVMHLHVGHWQTAPQIGFLAIDDKSVDPDYSVYSSPWGRGGWVTRSLWDTHLEQMGQIFRPKVLAYDILFRPVQTQAGDDASVATLNTIESKGDKDFLNELCNFEDDREAGKPTPKVVFAFEFPDDTSADQRLLTEEKSNQSRWFKILEQFRLPSGSVAEGSKARVHHTVRLPMDDILNATAYHLGAINAPSDPDGIYRHVPLIYAYQPPGGQEIEYMPGLALEAFLLWLDIELQDLKKPGEGLPCLSVVPGRSLTIQTARDKWTIPIDNQFRMALVPRFMFKAVEKGPTELFQPSFVELMRLGFDHLKAEAQPDLATTDEKFAIEARKADDAQKRIQDNGMILVVGEAFTGGTDAGDFPLEPGAPRPMLHLHALDNILQRDHLFELTFPSKAAICLVLALVMTWLYTLAPVRLAGLGSFALILCYPALVVMLLVAQNVQLPLIAPTVLAASCFGLNSYRIYRVTQRGREEMRRLFSSATSPHIARLIEENPAAFYTHRKTGATILFSDVEGFTTLSEKLDPPYLAAVMNRYLSPMTAIILQQDGYLHQYLGDGIMAIWGVLLPDPDHAYKACYAAWKQIEAARALRETLPDGKPYQFRVRIGVNSGTVSVGIMGSDQKTQYSAIGDEVNLAARLEPTNKDYGTQIIIGPKTYAQAKERIMVRRLDKIIVKGKSEAVLIYELLGVVELGTPVPGPWLAVFEEGMEHLWRREWDEADRCFAEADRLRGGDSPSRLQRARIAEYRLHPPPEKWQGEFTRLKKD